MDKKNKTIYKGGIGETIVKKSRFIASVIPCCTEEEAIAFIEKCKKEYWDATHNCSAYSIGLKNEITHCSDDGEPARTAGMPMLDVLLNEEIHNVCVVVTRYFGGTLLGTGGLVHAYQDAVKEGLSASEVISISKGMYLHLQTDYTGIGKIKTLNAEKNILTLKEDYSDKVDMDLICAFEDIEEYTSSVTEITLGKAAIEKGDLCQFAFTSDGPYILPYKEA